MCFIYLRSQPNRGPRPSCQIPYRNMRIYKVKIEYIRIIILVFFFLSFFSLYCTSHSLSSKPLCSFHCVCDYTVVLVSELAYSL